MGKEQERFRFRPTKQEGEDQSKRRNFSEDFLGWLGNVDVPGAPPVILPKEIFPFGREKITKEEDK
jgi:hypothetical protein